MTEQAPGTTGFEIGKDGAGTIVVGYDDTLPSVHAAAWASGMARREQALLVIVYVEPMSTPTTWVALGAAADIEPDNAFITDLRATAGALLTERGIRWDMVQGR